MAFVQSCRHIPKCCVFWWIAVSVLDNKCKHNHQSVNQKDFSCAFKCKSQHIPNLELSSVPVELWLLYPCGVCCETGIAFWNENVHPKEGKQDVRACCIPATLQEMQVLKLLGDCSSDHSAFRRTGVNMVIANVKAFWLKTAEAQKMMTEAITVFTWS